MPGGTRSSPCTTLKMRRIYDAQECARTGREARRFTSPLAAGAAIAAATGLLGMGMSAPAFGAVDKTVDDAVFNWSVNDESTGGAYFGGCNFLIAGEAGDTGMARIWTADDCRNHLPGRR